MHKALGVCSSPVNEDEFVLSSVAGMVLKDYSRLSNTHKTPFKEKDYKPIFYGNKSSLYSFIFVIR